jgi:hypothetical protein
VLLHGVAAWRLLTDCVLHARMHRTSPVALRWRMAKEEQVGAKLDNA